MEDQYHPYHLFLYHEQKHRDIHFNTLSQTTIFSIFISLSRKSHKLANSEYLECGLIGYPSGNTTSLYLDKIVSEFNYLTDPLVNEFV